MHKIILVLLVLGFTLPAIADSDEAGIVFLHGVYEDTSLYVDLANFAEKEGYDYLNLNLPGHGEDAPQSYELNYTRWFDYVEKQSKFFLDRNKKIIFVGHSLGAVLAVNYALDNPENVAGLVLIEPAFEPWSFIKAAACLGKNILKDARYFLPLARFFLRIPAKDRPIAVNMACEVTKLTPALLEKNKVNTIEQLAKLIKAPVLMLNNLDDNALDPTVNKDFFDSLSSKDNSIYHGFSNLVHGAIFLKDKETISKHLSLFLSSSL